MARKKKANWKTNLIGVGSILTGLVVGGLFLSGSTTSNVVLKYVPAVAHPLIGWLIVGSTLVFGVMGIVKQAKRLV